jgi:hypothetical protein
MEDNDLRVHTNRRGGRAEEYILNVNVAPSNDGVCRYEDEEANNVLNGNPENTSTRPDLHRVSTFRVLEAALVENIDDEVYLGTPVEPSAPPPSFRKLKRATITLVCVMVIAVAPGIAITNPVPSNAPSVSSFPSISQAQSISTLPSPPPTNSSTSMAPSSSTSPTSCHYLLVIAIDYDDKPEETYWRLGRIVNHGWSVRVEFANSHFASEGDTSYSESICLEEGEYAFAIVDDTDARDGICYDDGEGSYNVTVDDTLIVEGGEFGYKNEWTYFSLPFIAGTNEIYQYA